MKKYWQMLAAAVVIGALRVKKGSCQLLVYVVNHLGGLCLPKNSNTDFS